MTPSIKITDGTGIDTEAKDADFLVIQFSRALVEAGLIGDALDRLLSLSDSFEFTNKFASNMTIIFEGYDNDPRELHQIPECRHFFGQLTEKWPYWFHFMEKSGAGFDLIFQLLCSVTVVQVDRGMVGFQFTDPDEVRQTMLRLFDGMNHLYESHGITEEVNERMTEEVLKAFDRILD